MGQMYHFLDEMGLHGAPAALADWVAELGGLLEEENNGFHEVELTQEASSLSDLVAETELKEVETTYFKETKAFREERTSLTFGSLNSRGKCLQECCGPARVVCS